jgi:predicted lactoylglutathione lyase
MKKVFMNIISHDLGISREFYEGLGFIINEEHTDDKALCVIVSETIYFMVLLPEFFQTFLQDKKAIIDSSSHVQQMNSISLDSKEEVDNLYNLGILHGGKEFGELQDLEYMYCRDLQDPFGNILGFVWLNFKQSED